MAIKLFISHSAKDTELAKKVTKLFQYSTKLKDEEIRCTSVPPYNLDAGANTDETLQRELRESELVIGLLSRDSSDSYYVMAELGARWGINKNFMLIRSSNFSFSHFSGPLANLSISTIDTKVVLHKLCKQSAKVFGKKCYKTKALDRHFKQVIKENNRLSKTPLEIDSAQWGSDSTFREVSVRLRSVMKQFHIKTVVGCDLAMCDPTPGVPKTLKVTYTVLGKKQKVEIDEGDILDIP